MDWLTTKVSWRGSYERILRLTDAALSTLDPGDRRETNRFMLADVLAAEHDGKQLLIEVVSGGSCGLCRQQLHFAVQSVAHAAALCSAVRAKLTRTISIDDSVAARELSAESAVLSAMPRELASAQGGGLAASLSASSMAKTEVDSIMFDVTVSVLKARGLPLPPPMCGGPVVECHWGGPAEEHGSSSGGESSRPPGRSRGPSLARSRSASEHSGLQFAGLAAVSASPAAPTGPGGLPLSSGGATADGDPAGASLDSRLGLSPAAGASLDGRLHPPVEGERAEGEVEGEDLALLSAPVAFSTADGEGEASNPRWNYEACFRYRATDAELRSRRFELRLVHRRWPLGTPIEFGHVRVTLADIATGPHKFDLPIITPSGSHAGRIVFQVNMVQQCGLSILIPEVACTMRALARHTSQASQEAAHREASYSLSVSLTMAEGESQATRVDFDPKSLRLEKAQVSLDLPAAHKTEPKLALLATASAKAFDQESFHLCVWEKQSVAGAPKLLGEVWLPVTKVQQNLLSEAPRPGDTVNHSVFNEVLWLHGQRIGRLSGRVKITNGPKFVQLPGGFFTEMGILPIGPIAAGKDRSASFSGRDLPGLSGRSSFSDALSPSQPGGSLTSPVPGATLGTASLADFEQPPTGLKLPKEVELLVSLVQSLRKVILDLHLEPTAKRSGQPVGAACVSASTSALESATFSPSRVSADDQRVGSASMAAGGGSSGSGGGGGGQIKHSTSLTDLAGAELVGPGGGRAAGRLANSEMAARRLTFLMSRLQLLLGLSSKESCKVRLLPWLPMAPDGSRWLPMAPDGSRWVPMGPDGSSDSPPRRAAR